MIKLIANISCGALALWVFYSIFYFRVFPRMINHYRVVTKRQRKYDSDIDEIKKL
jgi:hypothetical protein